MASPDEEIPELPADTDLEGTVIGFSDSGSEPYVFAVVEVVRKRAVVVPVKDLRVKET
jgi:hypothetical protein